MSGIIGHTMYAILAGKAAADRKLPLASLIHRHYCSYLCGAYLGCDIQTLPAAVCIQTGQEVGYGSLALEHSPLTGGPVRPWSLEFGGRQYRPREIHRLFYGRAHLVFGYSASEQSQTVPWDHLPDYAAAVFEDAIQLYGPGQRPIAYLFGWLAHVVGDCLIKSVQPGIDLDLLDGKYTPRNRPIQDLVTFHEIGVKEFGLDWAALLTDLAETPVEPIQQHYMRVGQPRGQLSKDFADAWAPQLAPLLERVLSENRRYQRIRNPRLLELYTLTQTGQGPRCSEQLTRQSGGLSYTDMVGLAERADFRHALWQMGEAIVELFQQVVNRSESLAQLPGEPAVSWSEITAKWRRHGR